MAVCGCEVYLYIRVNLRRLFIFAIQRIRLKLTLWMRLTVEVESFTWKLSLKSLDGSENQRITKRNPLNFLDNYLKPKPSKPIQPNGWMNRLIFVCSVIRHTHSLSHTQWHANPNDSCVCVCLCVLNALFLCHADSECLITVACVCIF